MNPQGQPAPDRPVDPAIGAPEIAPTTARIRAMALAAGALAGLAAWLLGEAFLTPFQPHVFVDQMFGQSIERVRFEDRADAEAKNAAFAFGLLGGSLGLALGLAGGLTRRSGRGAAVAGLAGLALGAAGSILASLALLPVYFHAESRDQVQLSQDVMLPLLVHAGIWATAGLAGGAAFGLGLGLRGGRLLNAALGGLIGALSGSVLYEAIGAAAFPTSQTTLPISVTWPTRLMARMLVTVAAAAVTALAVSRAAAAASTRS